MPVEYVLTRPDRPRGRGRRLAAPLAKEVANDLGIPVRQPERLGGFDLGIDVVVLVDYGGLIPSQLLEQALWLNIHPSLLPRWRGAAPVERAIMAGDTKSGVSVIRLVQELDAGPVGAAEAFAIGPDDDAGAVFDRGAGLAPDLVEQVLESQEFRPQEGEPTYAEKIGPVDRELDWSRPASEVHGRRVIVWRSRLVDGELEVLDVQPEGGRRMTLAEFERGLR